VGATSVFVSHSVLVLLPIGLICVTCGIIGTYLLKFRNMNAEDGSGSLFRGRRSTSRSEPEAAQRAERFIPYEAVPNPAVPSEEGMVAPVQTPPTFITTRRSGATQSTAPTILGFGVLDKITCTFYSDGTIEANLARGKVKFGSMDELRSELDKLRLQATHNGIPN
jgi:hypothetical protein